MYKELLNKGFKPVYYTNADWETSRNISTRLFYRYDIISKDQLNIVLNVLNKFDEFFMSVHEDVFKSLTVQLEIDENLNSACIYFNDENIENYEFSVDEFNKILNILPNAYIMEHVE